MGACCSAPAEGAGGGAARAGGVVPAMDKSRREELKNRVVDLGDGFKVRRPPPSVAAARPAPAPLSGIFPLAAELLRRLCVLVLGARAAAGGRGGAFSLHPPGQGPLPARLRRPAGAECCWGLPECFRSLFSGVASCWDLGSAPAGWGQSGSRDAELLVPFALR